MESTFNFIINKDGFPIFQGNGFNEFMKANPGSKGNMKICLYDNRDKKKIAGYYHSYILEQLIIAYNEHEGIRYHLKEVENRIWNDLEVINKYGVDEVNIFKLSVGQINVLIEEIIRFSSINLNYFIK